MAPLAEKSYAIHSLLFVNFLHGVILSAAKDQPLSPSFPS
jgi:hypothetical protein